MRACWTTSLGTTLLFRSFANTKRVFRSPSASVRGDSKITAAYVWQSGNILLSIETAFCSGGYYTPQTPEKCHIEVSRCVHPQNTYGSWFYDVNPSQAYVGGACHRSWQQVVPWLLVMKWLPPVPIRWREINQAAGANHLRQE